MKIVSILQKGEASRLKNMKIDANGTEIRVMGDVVNEDAYISLTDIAKYKNPDNAFIVVANWMRNHSTISFLGLWEQIHNPNFKPIEFDRFKAESGDNAFTLTPQQWIKATDASIVVTHRLDENVLKQYDRIIVLHNGKVEECDIFEKLLEKIV